MALPTEWVIFPAESVKHSNSSNSESFSNSNSSGSEYSSSSSDEEETFEEKLQSALLGDRFNLLKTRLEKIATNLGKKPAEREDIDELETTFYTQYDFTYAYESTSAPKKVSEELSKTITKLIKQANDYDIPGPVFKLFLSKGKLNTTRQERLEQSTELLEKTYNAITDLSLNNINQLNKLTEKKENIRNRSLIAALTGLLICAAGFLVSLVYACVPSAIASAAGIVVFGAVCLGLKEYQNLSRTGHDVVKHLEVAHNHRARQKLK